MAAAEPTDELRHGYSYEDYVNAVQNNDIAFLVQAYNNYLETEDANNQQRKNLDRELESKWGEHEWLWIGGEYQRWTEAQIRFLDDSNHFINVYEKYTNNSDWQEKHLTEEEINNLLLIILNKVGEIDDRIEHHRRTRQTDKAALKLFNVIESLRKLIPTILYWNKGYKFRIDEIVIEFILPIMRPNSSEFRDILDLNISCRATYRVYLQKLGKITGLTYTPGAAGIKRKSKRKTKKPKRKSKKPKRKSKSKTKSKRKH